MFLISGNNTGTGILQNIMDANGRDLSAKRKQILFLLPSVRNTDTGATRSAKRSTMTVCRTTGVPTENTGSKEKLSVRPAFRYARTSETTYSLDRERLVLAPTVLLLCMVYGHGSISLKVAKPIWKLSSQT